MKIKLRLEEEKDYRLVEELTREVLDEEELKEFEKGFIDFIDKEKNIQRH